jgi:hypothetical protein
MGAIYIPYDVVTPTQSTSPASPSTVTSPNHVSEVAVAAHMPGWELVARPKKSPMSRPASDQKGRRDPCTTYFGITLLLTSVQISRLAEIIRPEKAILAVMRATSTSFRLLQSEESKVLWNEDHDLTPSA